MEYRIESYRHALEILNSIPDYKRVWLEVLAALDGISDEDIIELHKREFSKQKSISKALNRLIKERMEGLDSSLRLVAGDDAGHHVFFPLRTALKLWIQGMEKSHLLFLDHQQIPLYPYEVIGCLD